MTSVRGSALLLLDVTPATMRRDGAFASRMAPDVDLEGLAGRLRAAIRAARDTGQPLVWVVPGDDVIRRYGHREPTSEDGEPDNQVGVPLPSEPLVTKGDIGGFEASRLEEILSGLGVTDIVLAGVATQFVVRLTAAEGRRRGFRVRVLEDCCADLSGEAHARTIADLRETCEIVTFGQLWPPQD